MQHCVYSSHPCSIYLIAPPASLGATLQMYRLRVVCDGQKYVTWDLIVYSERSIFKWPWPNWGLWLVVRLCVYVYALTRLCITTFPLGSTVFSVSVMYHWLLNKLLIYVGLESLVVAVWYMSANNWFLKEQYWVWRWFLHQGQVSDSCHQAEISAQIWS